MGCKGRGAAKRQGKHLWEGPGGAAAATTAAPTTRTPRGRASDQDNKTHPWGDDGAIAALEFSLPSLGRRETGTWQLGGGGLRQADGDGGWGSAPGPLGRQNPYPGLGNQSGATSRGRQTARVPPRATAGMDTLPEEKPEEGTMPGTLPTRGETRPAVGALPEGAAETRSGYQAGGPRQDREPKSESGRPRFSSNHQGSPGKEKRGCHHLPTATSSAAARGRERGRVSRQPD